MVSRLPHPDQYRASDCRVNQIRQQTRDNRLPGTVRIPAISGRSVTQLCSLPTSRASRVNHLRYKHGLSLECLAVMLMLAVLKVFEVRSRGGEPHWVRHKDNEDCICVLYSTSSRGLGREFDTRAAITLKSMYLAMTIATPNDIVRLLPGIQDHTILETLAMEVTVAEVEALVQLLQDDDEGLIEVKQQVGGRLNRLLGILANSEIALRDNFEP